MDSNGQMIRSLVLYGFGLIGVTIMVNQLMKKRLKPFKRVAIVKKLFIYPVKSLQPIELDSFDHTDQQIYWKSLQDRAFMLVNRKNVMITQRQEPTLVKLIVTLEYPKLIVTTPDGSDSIELSIDDDGPFDGEMIKTNIWGDDALGVNCGSRYSEFFSNYLNKPGIKLIRFTKDLQHRPSQIYRDGQMVQDQGIKIKYHDAAMCLIINTKSIDQLNEWITNPDEKVNFMNFRPNIVIETNPFDEENWEKIRIGPEHSTEWQQLLKCVRCRVTTVNPETATFMKEPLVTLKSNHRPLSKEDLGYANTTDPHGRQQAPIMGVLFKSDSSGRVNVGQEIWASRKHGFFWFL